MAKWPLIRKVFIRKHMPVMRQMDDFNKHSGLQRLCEFLFSIVLSHIYYSF